MNHHAPLPYAAERPDTTVEVVNVVSTGQAEGRLANADVQLTTPAGRLLIRSYCLRRLHSGAVVLGHPSWKRPDGSYISVVTVPRELADEILRQLIDAYTAAES